MKRALTLFLFAFALVMACANAIAGNVSISEVTVESGSGATLVKQDDTSVRLTYAGQKGKEYVVMAVSQAGIDPTLGRPTRDTIGDNQSGVVVYMDQARGNANGTVEFTIRPNLDSAKNGDAYFIYVSTNAADADMTKVGSFTVVDDSETPSYTVTVASVQNGAVAAAPVSAVEGATIVLTAMPESGYEFDAWEVTDAYGRAVIVTDNAFTMPASDVTVSATFKVFGYYYFVTVASGITGGSVSANPVSPLPNSEVTLTFTPDSGYEFVAWDVKDANGNSIIVSDNKFFMPASDVTVSATFAPAVYAVTFNANGGTVSPSSKSVTQGEAYGELPTPIRTGYAFDGWFTATDGGTQVTASTTVNLSGAQDLYAHWTPHRYAVTFDANGGSVSPDSKSVMNGETYGDLPTPTRTGYTFSGWFTGAVAGMPQVTASTTVSLSGPQTLYAHWTANSYAVTFNANGGTVSQASKSVTQGATYGDLPTPIRNGYKFGGWFDAPDSGTQVTASTTVNLSGNQELFAHWTQTAVTYTVTFNANGGSVSPSSKSVAQGGTYGELPTPVRDGYAFDGWFDAASGGTQVTASTAANLSGAQELFAHWTAVQTQTVSAPTIRPSNVVGGVQITLSCATAGATIYYTTDGADPDASSTRYNGPFLLEKNCALKAVAILNGVRSAVMSSNREVPKAGTPAPTPKPDNRSFPSGTLVSLETDPDSADIHYTTDGSVPTLNSPKYVSGIPIYRDTTIRAIAALPGYALSDVMEAFYSVSLTEDNKAIVSVSGAEAQEDAKVTLRVRIDTTERTNVRGFKIVLHYGESLKYEGYSPMRGISKTDMTVGESKRDREISVQLSDNSAGWSGGDFFDLIFSVPSGAMDARIPVTIDRTKTTVTGTSNATSGRQDLTLLYEDGYVSLVNTNNSRIAFRDEFNNPITSVSQVTPGSELTVEPEAPSGDFVTASVFCAVYDRQGGMVRLQVWPVDLSDPLNVAMTGAIRIPENVEVGEIRVFVLSDDFVPLRSVGMLA